MKAIYVRWRDSTTTRGWREREPVIAEIDSLGYLIDETKNTITISHAVGAEDYPECLDQLTIPKECIKKRKWVKV